MSFISLLNDGVVNSLVGIIVALIICIIGLIIDDKSIRIAIFSIAALICTFSLIYYVNVSKGSETIINTTNTPNVTEALSKNIEITATPTEKIHNDETPESTTTATEETIIADEVVVFSDKEFEKMIRLGLNKPNEPIYTSDMLSIYSIVIFGNSHCFINDYEKYYECELFCLKSYIFSGIEYYEYGNITTLDDLTHCKNITKIFITYNKIEDINGLAFLESVGLIALGHNEITNIEVISKLDNIYSLTIADNNISDITPLYNKTSLSSLHLGRNNITDISALSSLINLKYLYIDNNPIEDLTPLDSLTLTNDYPYY